MNEKIHAMLKEVSVSAEESSLKVKNYQASSRRKLLIKLRGKYYLFLFNKLLLKGWKKSASPTEEIAKVD